MSTSPDHLEFRYSPELENKHHRLAEEHSETPWGLLPPRLSVALLCHEPVVARQIEQILISDRICLVRVSTVPQLTPLLELLRGEHFDAVILYHGEQELDLVSTLDGVRTSSRDHQAVLVLGDRANEYFETACLESGAESYLCLRGLTGRSLIWHLARASERQKLLMENRRLRSDREKHRQLAHQEVAQVLREMQELTFATPPPGAHSARTLPVPLSDTMLTELLEEYEELVQVYVMMGTGNLGPAVEPFATRLLDLGLSIRVIMQLHLTAIGRVIEQLGPRGSRHVFHRGQVLLLDLLLRFTTGDCRPRTATPVRITGRYPG